MPAARNAATAHSIALAISGEPVTRPPISSVKRRRFSSIGDGPMTMGSSLAATCAQLEASAVEQPTVEGFCGGARVSFFAGGSCACVELREGLKRRSNELKRKLRRMRSSSLVKLFSAQEGANDSGII